MSCDAERIAEHIRFLKRRILGNEVVHHQTLPARPARIVRDLAGLPPAMARILEIARIPALYTHQAEGIQKVLEGQHLAIATPTASGKTLVYNAPVLTTLLDDPEAHALYVFPLKALEQDQFDELNGLMQGLGGTLKAAIYDGDTTSPSPSANSHQAAAGAVHHAGHAALGHPRLPRGLGRLLRSSCATWSSTSCTRTAACLAPTSCTCFAA